MPLYIFKCSVCGRGIEEIRPLGQDTPPICCGCQMLKEITCIAYFRVKGQGMPARQRWFDNWHPGVPNLSIGSEHGARY